jgi:hypothetical protein
MYCNGIMAKLSMFGEFDHSIFGFVSNFVLRVSDLTYFDIKILLS